MAAEPKMLSFEETLENIKKANWEFYGLDLNDEATFNKCVRAYEVMTTGDDLYNLDARFLVKIGISFKSIIDFCAEHPIPSDTGKFLLKCLQHHLKKIV